MIENKSANRTTSALNARAVFGKKEERDHKKTIKVLHWLSTFGYSKSEILCLLLQSKNREHISWLAKEKLVKYEQHPKVLTIVLLTKKGKRLLDKKTQLHVNHCRRPNTNNSKHDMQVQKITCQILDDPRFLDCSYRVTGPMELAKSVGKRDKRADSEIIFSKNGKRAMTICVELELTKKYRENEFDFWSRIMKRIQEDPKAHFWIYFQTQEMLAHYYDYAKKLQTEGMERYFQNEYSKAWFKEPERTTINTAFLDNVNLNLLDFQGDSAPSFHQGPFIIS